MSTGANTLNVSVSAGASDMSSDEMAPPLEVSWSMKKRASRSDGGQVCIVSKCDSPLETAYSRRYRLCPEHMKAPQFLIAGELHRWCQKCGKFHPLTQFEGVKRSCRVSLERHNEKQKRLRVRKQAAAAAAAAAAPSAPAPSSSFSGSDAPIEVTMARTGSDASETTLGPVPLSLAPSPSPSSVIIVEPLPPAPVVFTLDEMSMVPETISFTHPQTSVDVSAWDAVALPSSGGAELEIDEFLAELMPVTELGLNDIDLNDLEASLFGGCGESAAPAPPVALDWAFAQF